MVKMEKNDIENEVRELISHLHKEGVCSPEINDILDAVSRIYSNRQEWYIHRWDQPNGSYVMRECLSLQEKLAKRGVTRDEFADVLCNYIDDTAFVLL